MNTDSVSNHYRDAWQAAAPAQSWLRHRSQQALEAFLDAGFPSTRQEDWKYTDLRRLSEIYPQWLTNKAETGAGLQSNLPVIADAINITVAGGHYLPELSDTRLLPDGVHVGTIGELAAEDSERLGTLLGQQASDSESSLVALNTAFSATGLVILIPAGLKLAAPICINHVGASAETVANIRVVAELGANASATIIEHFHSVAPVAVNAVSEMVCKPHAALRYCKLQNEHSLGWHTAAQFIRLAENASATTWHAELGAQLSRNQLKLELAGPHAQSDSTGIFMADGKRHTEERIDVEHMAPNTTSKERFRGILAGRARGVFNGRIHVHAGAQKTDASLSNRNLLLGKGAEINTKPELEIYADDVKCAHGSTTGQLDNTSLFYLLTRGVEPATAKRMLVTAFAAELFNDMPFPAIAAIAREALDSLTQDKHPS